MVFSLCNFCNAKFAVLCCTADSANLCLLCDRHVHSANTLSLKHERWWICHNCGAKPASVSTLLKNGLFLLCHGCDTTGNLGDQVHTKCSKAEDFTGCPSADTLASGLGFNDLLGDQEVVNFLDGSSGKDEVCEQLVEMARRDLVRLDVDGAELRPRTPPSRRLCQTTPFTSLPLLTEDLGLKQSDLKVADEEEEEEEEALLWDYNPIYDSSLVCLEKEILVNSMLLCRMFYCHWKADLRSFVRN